MTTVDTMPELTPQMLLDPSIIDDPYDFYRHLVREAPVWPIPGTQVVTINSYAAVTEAAGRVNDFSSTIRGVLYRNDDNAPGVMPFDPGPGMDVLATADPPLHTRHRSAVFPELVSRRMAELRPAIEAITDDRLAISIGRSRSEFMDDVANAVPIRVVSDLIAWTDVDVDRLLAAAFASTAVVRATGTLDEIAESMMNTAEIMEWIVGQLDRAIADGADGILGAVSTAINEGDLVHDDGIVMLHTLLSAGGESTTGLIANAVHLLATDLDLQDRLRAERHLLTAFIEEVLRLESPFRYHLRHVPATCDLQGVEIAAGSTALLMWGAANRDPAEYDEPDRVVLDRPSARHHLGFGRGIHLCVGAPLARLEADIVLNHLLDGTRRFSLDPDDVPVREQSLMVRRFRRLPLLLA